MLSYYNYVSISVLYYFIKDFTDDVDILLPVVVNTEIETPPY